MVYFAANSMTECNASIKHSVHLAGLFFLHVNMLLMHVMLNVI